MREQQLAKGGLMPGRDLATTFSALRPNDLVWNYVQSNYLKGKEPPAFDLLYWNADSTNLPGPMFCWYLRNMYLENNLREAGQADRGRRAGRPRQHRRAGLPLRLEGRPHRAVDGRVRVDEPAQSEEAEGQPLRAGRVRPHRRRDQPGLEEQAQLLGQRQQRQGASPKTADAWFEGATEHKGSWWPEWAAFLAENGGKDVKAPAKPGNAQYKPIEPAPGRYVKVRAD